MADFKPTARQPILAARKVGNAIQKMLFTRKMWELKVSTRIAGEAVVQRDGWKVIERFNEKPVKAPPEITNKNKKTTNGIDVVEVKNKVIAKDTDGLTGEALIALVRDEKWQIPNYTKLPVSDLLTKINERIEKDDSEEMAALIAEQEDKPKKTTRERKAKKVKADA